MKKTIIYLTVNIVYGLLLYVIFMISGFLLGYASNQNHLMETWVLFIIFALFHLLTWMAWTFHKKDLPIKTKIVVIITILFLWSILAIMDCNSHCAKFVASDSDAKELDVIKYHGEF